MHLMKTNSKLFILFVIERAKGICTFFLKKIHFKPYLERLSFALNKIKQDNFESVVETSAVIFLG